MIWIILSIVLYLYMGHCLFMLCGVVSGNTNQQTPGGWIIAMLGWPLVILLVGTIHTFEKIFE